MKNINSQNKIITVKNIDKEATTIAETIVQNQIDYTPKVSVIIPVYNVETYLRECLDSVINQTLKEIEIICVDDGSTDQSLEILKAYAARDNRITILTQRNLYAGTARNAGLSVARGEFLSFLDSDDYFKLEMLYEMYHIGSVENAHIVVCKYTEFDLRTKKERTIGFNEKIYSLYTSGRRELFNEKIYNFCSPVPWNKIYRRDFIINNNILFQNTIIANDIYMFLTTLSLAENISVVNKSFINYRKFQKNSLMSKREQHFLIPFETFNKFKQIISEDVFTKVRQSFEERLRSIVDLTENWVENKKSYYFQLINYANKIEPYVASIILKRILEKAPFFLLEYKREHNELSNITDSQLENGEALFAKSILISRLKDREYFKYISPHPGNIEEYYNRKNKPDLVFVHGSGLWSPQPETIKYAIENDIPLIRMEDSFLRSADTWCNHTIDKKYSLSISFTFTNDIFYFDATQSSYLERQINNPDFKLSDRDKLRSERAIKYIIDNHLTKYNHQPIYTPKIGRIGVEKILVVDQSYGDFSIKQGLADDNTFKKMLDAAIEENPNADIIVKTHPDAIAPGTKRPLGYYSELQEHDNVYLLRAPINPISLIKYVDKVYVCTTQLGFEALMCGKEVHTFGMPFYAGWGLTIDKLTCPRRTVKRSLEEIFYITYIKNTYYIDPTNKCRCTIERAMQYLVELRTEYQKYLRGESSSHNSKKKSIEFIKAYLFFPYYWLQMLILRNKGNKKAAEQIVKILSTMRVDINNIGSAQNSIFIKAEGAEISQPKWMKNAQGIGLVLECQKRKQKIDITAIKDGKLVLAFRGTDKRYNKERIPLWIDFSSIKIDDKEILSGTVATWHDKPFRYEMPIKDGQTITVEIEQSYHSYNIGELRELVSLLNIDPIYLDDVIQQVHQIVTKDVDKECHRFNFS